MKTNYYAGPVNSVKCKATVWCLSVRPSVFLSVCLSRLFLTHRPIPTAASASVLWCRQRTIWFFCPRADRYACL